MIQELLDLKLLSGKYGNDKIDRAFNTVINVTFDVSSWMFRPDDGHLSVTYTPNKYETQTIALTGGYRVEVLDSGTQLLDGKTFFLFPILGVVVIVNTYG